MAKTKVKGLDQFKRRCRSLSRQAASAVAWGVVDAAEAVAAEARLRAPVDTGELRDAIVVEVRPSIGDRAEAAVVVDETRVEGDYHPLFVEVGTSKMAPRPFLTPAAESKKVEVVRRVARPVARVLNRGARR